MKFKFFYLSIVLMGAASCAVKKDQTSKSADFPKFSAEAHRGGRGLMPENTVMAMKNAMSFPNITTLEMDTHITKDGKVVVAHDDYLSPKYVLTPDGKEIPKEDAKKYNIFKMDYALLKTFDHGTKFYKDFPQQKKVAAHIPLLEDLIDSVQAEIKNKGLKPYFYNIETKCSQKGDGITNPSPEVFVEKLMAVILKKKIEPYVVIQSFDKRTLQIIHKQYPTIKTSYLVNNKKSYEENKADLGFKPFILSPNFNMVNAELVSKAHADGVKIIPWTANTQTDIDRLKALGVDGIITDYPNLL